jgi:hypothetical protein
LRLLLVPIGSVTQPLEHLQDFIRGEGAGRLSDLRNLGALGEKHQ